MTWLDSSSYGLSNGLFGIEFEEVKNIVGGRYPWME